MTTAHYAIVTIRNPKTGGLDTIGGQTPITGDPDTVKADLEKAMRGKCGPDFVSVRILTMPANFSQMENER